MKDWIEILIGVVVFGVLIFVHLLDHILALRKHFLEKKQEANEQQAAEDAVYNQPPTLQPAPPRIQTLNPFNAGQPKPPPSGQRKPPGGTPVLRPAPMTQDQKNMAIPKLALTATVAPVSPIVTLVHGMLRDPKSLAAAFILQEVLGPPPGMRRPTEKGEK